MATTEGKGVLLKSDAIADGFRAEIKATLAAAPRPPKLVGILSTAAEPSKFYAEFTRKQCEALGVAFELRRVGQAADASLQAGEGAEEAIIEANEDDTVDGIMVYYPVFGAQQDHYLQQVVSPLKDVEGLHAKWHYNLYHNIRFLKPETLASSLLNASASGHLNVADDQPPPGYVKSILPCTPLAIVKVLEYTGVYNKLLPYGDRAYGKTITVINRSEVVGRPLAALLANDGARVFSVDIDSIQEYTKRPQTAAAREFHTRHVAGPATLGLDEVLKHSDVVVSAVPSRDYKVRTAALKDGCVAVNVAADKNFEADVRDRASIYLPTIGKVTIMMLLRNL
ncbi:NAD(P)-binding protein [Epithele typhae]|uniref:NAD(P)-binding protein n=1 Tax=Epithele typhae TaxID=378194 RepID=UPI0020072278|nr:NAD(P)-binding protein [Epithele typhae]KAH9927086.1 NAD(P)-binding protein [Epithele typhae]